MPPFTFKYVRKTEKGARLKIEQSGKTLTFSEVLNLWKNNTEFTTWYIDSLNEIGFDRDYSMGYPQCPGFRASIAASYSFYDLRKEEITDLKIYPFALMDVSLHDYLNLNTAQAAEKCKQIVKEVKDVEGLFISVWHNNNLSETDGWEGWNEVYEELLQAALPEDA